MREGKRRVTEILTGIERVLASALSISYLFLHLILQHPCASDGINPHLRNEKIKRRRLSGLPSNTQKICGYGFEPRPSDSKSSVLPSMFSVIRRP